MSEVSTYVRALLDEELAKLNTAKLPGVVTATPATVPAPSELQDILDQVRNEVAAELKKLTGHAPAMVQNVVQDVEDAVPTVQELFGVIQNLRGELNALKQNAAKSQATADAVPELSQGGEPVPHDLHLTDGRVIAAHAGLATHYDDGNSITRVIGAYPSN